MTQRELDQQIQAAFDGELSEAGAASLREVLRTSPEALERYCEHALLESELRRHAASRGKIPGTIPYRTRLTGTLRQRRQVRLAALAAAAVLLVAGFALHLVWFAPEPTLARLEVSAGSSLCHADGSALRGNGLQRNQAVTLGQGVVRFEFESGVEAVIDGPATITLPAADRVVLDGGHAWFRVPHQARGFRVETVRFDVVDLGTEFGVDLREDVAPQVHVLQGEVEVVSHQGNRTRTRLRAGAAGTLEPNGSWAPGPAVFDKFRSRLPEALPLVEMDFETLADGRLEIGGNAVGVAGSTARVVNPERVRLVPGVAGRALQLNGDGAYVETTWPGIAGAAPRTVALWCRVPEGETFATAPALAFWGNPALGVSRKFKVALCTTDQATVLRTSFGNTLFNGTTPLADGRWHHLAVVYHGNGPDGKPRVTMWVDGRSEPGTVLRSDSNRIETDTVSGNPLEIGRYELSSYGNNPYLKASLDQFRVFAGALTEAEIRDLAEKSVPPAEIR